MKINFNSRSSFTPLAAALALLVLTVIARADGTLSTDVGYNDSTGGDSHQQSSDTAFSLSDSSTGAFGSASVTASFGGISLSSSNVYPVTDPSGVQSRNTSAASFIDYFTITTGNPGETGTLRFTMRLGGALAGSGQPQGGWDASCELQVSGSGPNGTNFDFTAFNSQNGETGMQPSAVGSFVASADFTSGGAPSSLVCNMGEAIDAYSTGSQATPAGDGSAHADLVFSIGSYTVVDSQGQPMNYTAESRTGSARGMNIPGGGSYNGFTLTNNAPGRSGSTLQLLGGVARTATNVNAAFVAPPDPSENVTLVSDAVDLTGTNSDPVVVQVSIDQHGLAGAIQYLELGWFKSAGVWTNAVLGNSGATVPTYVTGAYNPATDFHLGYYGFDLVNKVAWAVVNHNSRFGVMPSPLAIRSLTRPAANTVHLNCKGEPGAVNRLEASTTLAANSFTTIASIAVDDTGTFQYDDTHPGTRKFYRVAYP